MRHEGASRNRSCETQRISWILEIGRLRLHQFFWEYQVSTKVPSFLATFVPELDNKILVARPPWYEQSFVVRTIDCGGVIFNYCWATARGEHILFIPHRNTSESVPHESMANQLIASTLAFVFQSRTRKISIMTCLAYFVDEDSTMCILHSYVRCLSVARIAFSLVMYSAA